MRVDNSNITSRLSNFIDNTCELIKSLQSFIYTLLHLPNLVENYLFPNRILLIILQLRCYLVEYPISAGVNSLLPEKNALWMHAECLANAVWRVGTA